MFSLIQLLGIEFSQRHNRLYDINSFLLILFQMIDDTGTANTAATRLAMRYRGIGIRIPSSRWFRNKATSLEFDVMESRCRMMMDDVLKWAKKRRVLKNRYQTLIMDLHLRPRYDKELIEGMVKSKGTKGTTKYEGCATAQLVGPPNLHVGCHPLSKGFKIIDSVRKLLADASRNGIKVGLLLVDRGFFSVEVITELQMLKIRFLMPAVKTPGIKRAIEEFIGKKRKAVSKYTMTSRDGKKVTFTLVIVRKKDGEDGTDSEDKTMHYMVFAISGEKRVRMAIESIPEEYRQRWVIETGYRVVEGASGRTTSTKPSYRFFLFCMGLVNANLWIIARFIYGKNTDSDDEITMSIFLLVACRVIFSSLCEHDQVYTGPGPPT